MTGLPSLNFPAFHRAAAYLRKEGWEVVNPAEMGEACGFDPARENYEEAYGPDFMDSIIRQDLEAVLSVDAVYTLPGWSLSKGALAEVAVAKWAGKEVWPLPPSI